VSNVELAYRSIGDLGRLLRSGETSPTELTRLYLERLSSVGTRLNAVVTITEERALREAALAEGELRAGVDRGPLHGIPYGAKDLLATADSPTTWGAAPFKDQMFTYDATVIRKLGDAGAILVAKLATVEIAGGMGYNNPDASFTGPTVNPWDVTKWTSGSSSGPGAAVAAGTVAFAIGSDTGGSITLPGAWCGVAGLRATYGRVSRAGAMALAWTLDRLGPMCRSAEDCGLVLEAIAGFDHLDPTSERRTYHYRRKHPRRQGFRFGLIEGISDGVQPEVKANFDTSLDILRELGTVEEVALPEFPYDDLMETIIAAEAYSAFDDFIAAGRTAELTAEQAHTHRMAAMFLPAHDYIRAQRIRRHVAVAMDELTGRFDALIGPTLGTVASGLRENFEYMLHSAFPRPLNYAGNLSGLPAITIANGLGQGNLPTGIQFVGRTFAENAVLDAAHAFELRSDWRLQLPPIGESLP
jgi:aspartyl-tRNA(Asn)/glutamyl-tRNA(Gln) amidotransferase subunit A